MLAKILDQLTFCGWTATSNDLDLAANFLAFKEINTAVGKKEAVVRMRQSSNGIAIYGEYWSEGRNVLSTCDKIIPPNSNAQEIQKQVQDFTKEVDCFIDQTYAVTILKRKQKDSSCDFG